MTTYWVLGKGVSASQLTSPVPMPAGVPMEQAPTSLTRQASHQSSLAAVVFGMMQATKRNTAMTRKLTLLIFIL